MTEPLVFRPMTRTEDDLRAFGECFSRNGTPRSLDGLRWQYVQNPTDKMFVDLAFSDSHLAAIYAVQPSWVRVGAVRALAAQSVDTLVDSQFRGRGLFPKMAQQVYQRVAEQGGAFVYGFPNASSAPGFFGKLGWVSLDPVPFLIRPLRVAFLASKLPLGPLSKALPDLRFPVAGSRLKSSLQVRPVIEFGSELHELWKRFASEVRVAVDRDPEYLSWRLARPGERYQCLGVFDDARLVAFCAFKTIDKHGGRVGYVIELLHAPGGHRVGAALLSESLRHMASDGADAVLAWCFGHSPNRKAFRMAGFLPLPEALRPIELHFGVRPLDPSLTPMLSARRNWYLSYCDSDTV